ERYSFYIGQSFFDYKDYKNSLIWYKKRLTFGGWDEELYFSKMRIGLCQKKLGEPHKNIIYSLLECSKIMPSRAEPLYYLGKLHKTDLKKAYYYFNLA